MKVTAYANQFSFKGNYETTRYLVVICFLKPDFATEHKDFLCKYSALILYTING